MTLGVGVSFEDVLVGRDQEPGGTAGWVYVRSVFDTKKKRPSMAQNRKKAHK